MSKTGFVIDLSQLEKTIKNIRDSKIRDKVEKYIVRRYAYHTKKDAISLLKSKIRDIKKAKKYINYKIYRDKTAVLKATYIARFVETGVKERIPKKAKVLYFIVNNNNVFTKYCRAIPPKPYFSETANDLENGKFDNAVLGDDLQKYVNKILEKRI